MYTIYVGIDISAQDAHAFWYDSTSQHSGKWVIPQTKSGYQRLLKQLLTVCHDPRQTLLVMEATANYWLALARFLHEHHFVVSVINPIQGKRFAQMQLRRAKTDPIDAQMLCDFAQMVQPPPWTPPPPIYYQLQQRLALREDLVLTRTQFRNRLHAMKQHPHAEDGLLVILQQQIDQLSQQIAALTDSIQTLLLADHHWQQATDHLLSIPGLGILTTAWILTLTHCFVRCATPQQAAAYAGLVPHPQQSGQSNKRGQTGGGNKTLRCMLYLAAGSALQHNPILKPFYQKLLKRGKLKNVARVAVARKLMHIAWACVTKKRDFDPHYLQQPQAA